MEQTALKPVKLQIRINGSGEYNGTTKPFPHVYISDALSQNILYSCYQAPKTVEELAKLCGVPAYYVEDRIGNLLAREAVSEPKKSGQKENEKLPVLCLKHSMRPGHCQMQHMPHPVDIKEMNVGSHCGIGRVYSHIPV